MDQKAVRFMNFYHDASLKNEEIMLFFCYQISCAGEMPKKNLESATTSSDFRDG